MKKLDLYIIRKFLGTFFFALLLIICVAVIFDISEQMDDFLRKNLTFDIIFTKYYLYFIPYFANLFSSLFVFIAVIFFTSRMAAKTEFIAMLSSGISLRRLLWPYFISATIITAFSFVLGNYVIPESNNKMREFKIRYLHSSPDRSGIFNYHSQVFPDVYFYAEMYEASARTGRRVTIENFDGITLKSKLFAETMSWDSVKQKWTMQNYHIRTFSDTGETLVTGESLDTVFGVVPEDFELKNDDVAAMNKDELEQHIDGQRRSGTPAIITSLLEKHSRVANPFAAYILTIIGFSLSVRKIRGGLGINIGIGLLLSFSYILFQRFTTVFALSGLFPPALSVWIPNIIFTCIAVIVYFTSPK